MAFDRTGLYCVNPSVPPGHRLWTYVTLDTLATVDTSGYFNSAARELAIGDVILGKVVTGSIRTPATITAAGHALVLTNTGAVVNTSDFTAIATTNTD